jgi:hypothetical protein
MWFFGRKKEWNLPDVFGNDMRKKCINNNLSEHCKRAKWFTTVLSLHGNEES